MRQELFSCILIAWKSVLWQSELKKDVEKMKYLLLALSGLLAIGKLFIFFIYVVFAIWCDKRRHYIFVYRLTQFDALI